MKFVMQKALTICAAILIGVSLSGCGQTIRANGGLAVEEPYAPDPDLATDGEIHEYMLDMQGAVQQCNANFDLRDNPQ